MKKYFGFFFFLILDLLEVILCDVTKHEGAELRSKNRNETSPKMLSSLNQFCFLKAGCWLMEPGVILQNSITYLQDGTHVSMMTPEPRIFSLQKLRARNVTTRALYKGKENFPSRRKIWLPVTRVVYMDWFETSQSAPEPEIPVTPFISLRTLGQEADLRILSSVSMLIDLKSPYLRIVLCAPRAMRSCW